MTDEQLQALLATIREFAQTFERDSKEQFAVESCAAFVRIRLSRPTGPAAPPAAETPTFFMRCSYCGQKPCQCEDMPASPVVAPKEEQR